MGPGEGQEALPHSEMRVECPCSGTGAAGKSQDVCELEGLSGQEACSPGQEGLFPQHPCFFPSPPGSQRSPHGPWFGPSA